MRDNLEFLDSDFLVLMNDIGRYGFEKYGADSFQTRRSAGDYSRGTLSRTLTPVIARHAREHFEQYQKGIVHDHFKTLKHQLAAVAFNAMMEFYFAEAEIDKSDQRELPVNLTCPAIHPTRNERCGFPANHAGSHGNGTLTPAWSDNDSDNDNDDGIEIVKENDNAKV